MKSVLSLVAVALLGGPVHAQGNRPVTVDDRLASAESRLDRLEAKVDRLLGASGRAGGKCGICGADCRCDDCGCDVSQTVANRTANVVTDAYGQQWTVTGCETGKCVWTKVDAPRSATVGVPSATPYFLPGNYSSGGSFVAGTCASGDCGVGYGAAPVYSAYSAAPTASGGFLRGGVLAGIKERRANRRGGGCAGCGG